MRHEGHEGRDWIKDDVTFFNDAAEQCDIENATYAFYHPEKQAIDIFEKDIDALVKAAQSKWPHGKQAVDKDSLKEAFFEITEKLKLNSEKKAENDSLNEIVKSVELTEDQREIYANAYYENWPAGTNTDLESDTPWGCPWEYNPDRPVNIDHIEKSAGEHFKADEVEILEHLKTEAEVHEPAPDPYAEAGIPAPGSYQTNDPTDEYGTYQPAKNDDLRAENDSLKTENAALKAENAALKAENDSLSESIRSAKALNETYEAENEGLKQQLENGRGQGLEQE